MLAVSYLLLKNEQLVASNSYSLSRMLPYTSLTGHGLGQPIDGLLDDPISRRGLEKVLIDIGG